MTVQSLWQPHGTVMPQIGALLVAAVVLAWGWGAAAAREKVRARGAKRLMKIMLGEETSM